MQEFMEVNMNIRNQTYRKNKLTLIAGSIYKYQLGNTRPNHFIINNSVNDVLYISDTPNVSNVNFSKRMQGVTRSLYAEINGLTTLYLLVATSGEITIESYYADFTENSISPTYETTNSSTPGTPKSETISLTGGVIYNVKLTPGWVVSFGAGTTPNVDIRNGLRTV